MKVVVDHSKCQGVGMCESISPELFLVGDDAVAELQREPTDADRDDVEQAVEACPTLALSVEP